MEPIKTPSNEALNMKIDALGGRICMFESDITAYREFARDGNDRNLSLILQVADRVNKLFYGYITLSICIILLSLCILSRGNFYSTVDCIFKTVMPFIGLFAAGTTIYLHFGYKKMYFDMKERYIRTQEKLQRTEEIFKPRNNQEALDHIDRVNEYYNKKMGK